jgi:glycosyltransferase involved in cell wall biosynthesis
VGSAVGGILDIIEDGKTGFFVEPGNAAAIAEKAWQIISTAEIQEEMGTRGRLSVEKRFSWEIKSKEILEVYRSIVE